MTTSPNHNKLQAACSGFEYTLGEMYAIREFSFSKERDKLTGVVFTEPWTQKYTATCMRTKTVSRYVLLSMMKRNPTLVDAELKSTIRYTAEGTPVTMYIVPSPCGGFDPECTCGIYAYHSREARQKNSYSHAEVVGVVKATGKTIVGTIGLRTEHAEVVALAPVYSHAEQLDDVRSSLTDARLSLASVESSICEAERLLDNLHDTVSKSPRIFQKAAPWIITTGALGGVGFGAALLALASAARSGSHASFIVALAVSALSIALSELVARKIIPRVMEYERACADLESLIESLEDLHAAAALYRSDIRVFESLVLELKLSMIATDTRVSEFSAAFRANYTGVCYHDDVESMLNHHPLTGVEGFRDN